MGLEDDDSSHFGRGMNKAITGSHITSNTEKVNKKLIKDLTKQMGSKEEVQYRRKETDKTVQSYQIVDIMEEFEDEEENEHGIVRKSTLRSQNFRKRMASSLEDL